MRVQTPGGAPGPQPSAPPESETAQTAAPGAYGWYVVAVLMLTYTLSLLDRKLPFILVESIKRDLSISDTQVGLLTGVMFALVYSTAAIPIARLSDRKSRKTIIIIALFIWSSLTSLGGFARSFWQLAGSRVGVAFGEAACSPAAHSMIADYFPPKLRARALGLYFTGAQLGMLLGLVLGGWINDLANWRVAMMLLGAPGLLLMVLLAFTVKEPPRSVQPGLAIGEGPSLAETIRTLFSQRAIVHMLLAAVLFMFTGGATEAFTPAYIIRTFGLTAGQTGLTYGVVVGVSGIVGAALGGLAGDRLRRTSPWKAMLFVAITFSIGMPCLAAAYFMNSYPAFLCFIFIAQVAAMSYAGPSFSTLQSLVPPRMHAVASAVYLFALSGIGISLGPLVVGLLSDWFHRLAFENPLRWALIIVTLPMLWAALHYLIAALELRRMAKRP